MKIDPKKFDLKKAKDAAKDFLKNFDLKKFDPKKFDLKKAEGIAKDLLKKGEAASKNLLKDKKRLLLTVFIVVIGVVIFAKTTANIQKAVFKKSQARGKAPGITFEEEATPVKVFKVKKTDFKDTLPAIGNVKGFKEVDLMFQLAGVVESWNFEEGEKVQEGDIIVSMIQRDQLLKLKYSEVEYKKNQKLYDLGSITTMKLEQSRLEYESAKSELDKTNIYAMSNGYLGSKEVDVGGYVNPSTNTTERVGVFVAIDKVFAEFNIIEKDIPKIALGQKVDVFVDAYPTKAFNGTVDRIAPVVEGRSRTQMIKVELDNKENLLKPGMFVRSLIYTYEKKDVIVVPASALKKKEADYFAYVVHKEEAKPEAGEEAAKKKKGWWPFGAGAAKKKEAKKEAPEVETKEKPLEYGTIEVRKLKLGYMTQDLVEVEEGLQEDELVVVEIQEELKDKARVEIMEVQEGLI
jgi:membrane fusion protein (multidrug efflux system)